MIHYPVVNLNGTSRDELIEQRCDAMRALRDAMAALTNMGPNGRDFQTARSGAFECALKVTEDRLLLLRQMMRDIEAETDHLAGVPS